MIYNLATYTCSLSRGYGGGGGEPGRSHDWHVLHKQGDSFALSQGYRVDKQRSRKEIRDNLSIIICQIPSMYSGQCCVNSRWGNAGKGKKKGNKKVLSSITQIGCFLKMEFRVPSQERSNPSFVS